MEIDQQETNDSQIEHNLLSKQRDDDNMDVVELYLNSSPPSSDVIIITDDDEEEATLKPPPRDNVDAFNELGIMVNGIRETKKDNEVTIRADLCFSSTDLNEKKPEEKNEGVVESSTSKKGDGHVSLDDLGVTVEDLKNIPWEAFDPTWEMRSWANDPWLCGHVEDLASPQNDSDT